MPVVVLSLTVTAYVARPSVSPADASAASAKHRRRHFTTLYIPYYNDSLATALVGIECARQRMHTSARSLGDAMNMHLRRSRMHLLYPQ
ncbi:hypothetical protein AA0113_g9587 [Alternaria arborescens]|uniref:Uncharacterized protein n=1 Tax=Alternaria arborescens TaxID=156630 RepID=A0A4Q4R8Z5_9PLEO|nr:hypothetical protein AA0113_g9587 [Alternaria arborescens]